MKVNACALKDGVYSNKSAVEISPDNGHLTSDFSLSPRNNIAEHTYKPK